MNVQKRHTICDTSLWKSSFRFFFIKRMNMIVIDISQRLMAPLIGSVTIAYTK